MSFACRVHNFRRAETLRKILFGDQPLFRVWSKKNHAFYSANRSGYQTDSTRAGLYTREEAESLVRSAGGMLEAYDLAGGPLVIAAANSPLLAAE